MLLTPSSKGVVSKYLRPSLEGDMTICLSGVLARGEEQFAPVLQSLPGEVITYHTEGRRHLIDNLVEDVVADLTPLTIDGPVRFIGASMGGMEVPFVIERFRQENPDVNPARLQVVIVDAPSGLESLMNPQAKLLKSGLVAGMLVGLLPSFVTVPVADDGLPKWDDITVPEQFAFGPVVYKQSVIDHAREYLSGYPMSLLFSQTHWMIKVGSDGTLARACKSLDGIDTTYVSCLRSNDVVTVDALEHWKSWVPHLKAEFVNGTHCGFLQNQPEFSEVFEKILVYPTTQ